jgi:Ulp1 family protease
MAKYDEVIAEFKGYLKKLGTTSDTAMWQEIVVHNFLYNFLREAGYLLVKRWAPDFRSGRGSSLGWKRFFSDS